MAAVRVEPAGKFERSAALSAVKDKVKAEFTDEDGKPDAAAKEALVAAYPAPPKPDDSARVKRAVLSIAETVHESLRKLTRKAHPFPATYDAAAVAKLRALW